MKAAGLDPHYADHDSALHYHNAAGVPFTATYIQAKASNCRSIRGYCTEEKHAQHINGSLTYQMIQI